MSLRVRFSIPPGLRNRDRHRRRKKRSKQCKLYVDIGISEDFVVKLGRHVDYDIIHSSEKSVLARLIEDGKYTDVIVVRWGPTREAALDKDEVSSSIASKVVNVPKYKGKTSRVIEGKHVSVSLRTYVSGIPLSAVIGCMSSEKLDHIKLQVSAIVTSLASKTSPDFGSIRHTKFKTNSAEAFLTRCVITETLSGNSTTVRMLPVVPGETHKLPAVLCHRGLTPEHIIMDGVSVSGIVGWSSADYVPEAVDRTTYEYSNPKRKFVDWYRYLTNIPHVYSSSRPSDAFLHNVKQYCKMANMQANYQLPTDINKVVGRGPEHPSLESERESNNASCRSDCKSLDSLLSNTIDTWEKSTTTTYI